MVIERMRNETIHRTDDTGPPASERMRVGKKVIPGKQARVCMQNSSVCMQASRSYLQTLLNSMTSQCVHCSSPLSASPPYFSCPSPPWTRALQGQPLTRALKGRPTATTTTFDVRTTRTQAVTPFLDGQRGPSRKFEGPCDRHDLYLPSIPASLQTLGRCECAAACALAPRGLRIISPLTFYLSFL